MDQILSLTIIFMLLSCTTKNNKTEPAPSSCSHEPHQVSHASWDLSLLPVPSGQKIVANCHSGYMGEPFPPSAQCNSGSWETAKGSCIKIPTQNKSLNKDDQSEPVFHGTIFINSDIIRSSDPSSFKGIKYKGTYDRTMFDRRVNNWIRNTPFVFTASFSHGREVEVQVNSEFVSLEIAQKNAEYFSYKIGQVPKILFKYLETVWIHKGHELFGGGNNNLLIYTEMSEKYEKEGILEETLFHELTHTSIDPDLNNTDLWHKIQKKDSRFISKYAQSYPDREDIAESLLLIAALLERKERLKPHEINIIENSIPNRILFFKEQGIDLKFPE